METPIHYNNKHVHNTKARLTRLTQDRLGMDKWAKVSVYYCDLNVPTPHPCKTLIQLLIIFLPSSLHLGHPGHFLPLYVNVLQKVKPCITRWYRCLNLNIMQKHTIAVM